MSDTPTPTAPAAEKKSGSRRTLVLAIGALVVLIAAGGGAYWFLKGRTAEAAAAQPEAAKEDKGPGGIVPLDTFVVNLADPSGSRYLRTNIALVVDDEEHAKELTENAVAKMRVRSAVLELLAQQSADALVTPEGKSELKKAIAERASKAAEDTHIGDVLFSEFVVQF